MDTLADRGDGVVAAAGYLIKRWGGGVRPLCHVCTLPI